MATSYLGIVTSDYCGILIAAAVRKGPHAAIVYRSDDSQPRILHFAWHHFLKDDALSDHQSDYVCVVPIGIERDDQVALAAYCRRIYRANASRCTIPYNLRYDPETSFDPDTGDFVRPETATGLNCATFVVQVFRSSGNPILDGDGWPQRPKDVERQRYLVDYLRNCPNPAHRDPAQADLIELEIGCMRIRPEEVVGACLEKELPALFGQCEPNGYFLIGLVEAKSQGLSLERRP
jgi:hypothetical protein